MGSGRLGVVAKMDLVESKVSVSASLRRDRAEAKGEGGQSPMSKEEGATPHPGPLLGRGGEGEKSVLAAGEVPSSIERQSEFTEDLFTQMEVCPVDYKAGAPRKGEDANELWDTDKMQLGLQALILRENGYTC